MFRVLVSLLFCACALGQTIDEVVLPAKTEIFVSLERSINTKTATAGDKFYGRVAVPVTANDKIVIPEGTHIIGHVDYTKKPGYVKGKAQLELKFDTVILPDGTTRQIQAVVESAEGYQTRPDEEEGTIEASGSQGKETATGAAGGAVTGAVIGGVSRGSVKGLATGAAIGAAGGAIIGIFQKGEQVVLPKGTSITVQLNDSIRFVKPEPRNPGTRLTP